MRHPSDKRRSHQNETAASRFGAGVAPGRMKAGTIGSLLDSRRHLKNLKKVDSKALHLKPVLSNASLRHDQSLSSEAMQPLQSLVQSTKASGAGWRFKPAKYEKT